MNQNILGFKGSGSGL